MGVFITFVQIQAVSLIVNIALIALSIYLIKREEPFEKWSISPQTLGYISIIPFSIAFLLNLYFCISMISDFIIYGSNL